MPNLFDLAQSKKSSVAGRGQGKSVFPGFKNNSTKSKRQRTVTNSQNGRFRKRKRELKWKNYR